MVDVPSRAEFDAVKIQSMANTSQIGILHDRLDGLELLLEAHLTEVPPVVVPPPEPPPVGSRDVTVWPFTSTSAWNMPIGSGAQFGSDAGLPPAGSVNARFWSHPIYIAKVTDPLVRVWRYSNSNDRDSDDNRYPDRTKLTMGIINIPEGYKPAEPDIFTAQYSDSHMHVIDPTHTEVFEMFGTRPQADGSIRVTAQYTGSLYGDGVGDFRGAWQGTRAYGGSALSGLIREWDLEQGRIPHALAAAIGGQFLVGGPVWPATIQDSFWRTGYSGTIPMGAMFAIPSTTRPDGLTPQGIMIWNALCEFGMFITDTGGPYTTLYAEPKLDSRIDGIRTDWPKIRPYLRRVTNVSVDNVGGGGTPIVPMAPALVGEF